jgi:DNA-binding helix-hairpin-helix protein with protein kinase domain
MTYTGLHNETYFTGRELGRGGEGCVYELQNHRELVLKLYAEPLPPAKIAKLEQMIAMRTEALAAYAALPADLIHDTSGKVCGFVMKKLTAYVPLHHVFSPMDRKKMFPDKGYNFLVHVARNLSTAFHQLHQAGIVVGDVNEGNILISSSGLAAFIDCDSFQIPNGNTYFFCEVGVPRYTPPELLRLQSFERVVRTTNTDNFSLAILLFQLLFLGRHPYAGKHRGAADIDEETAIKQHQFAYSLHNLKKKLSPPPDSFDINSLPADVIALFHQAFETSDRPTPAQWVAALGNMLTNIVTCPVSRLHSYPAPLTECPWCLFRKNRGIMYFLDDSYMQANNMLQNIEQFINGFKPETISVKKITPGPAPTKLTPTPPGPKLAKANTLRRWVSLYLCIAGVVIALFYPIITLLFIAAAVWVYKKSGWVKLLIAERNRRVNHHFVLHNRLTALIKNYEQPTDVAQYNSVLQNMQQLIHNFRRLPDMLEQKKKAIEEILYNQQLDDYLRQFHINDYTIPSIGKVKKTSLLDNGIRNAAHITRLATTRVPGIGPANEAILLNWRRQMSAGFVYIPDNYQITVAMQKVNDEIAQVKNQLEQQIRKEYQTLSFLKTNISNKNRLLEIQIEELTLQVRQAEVDVDAFKKFAA